MVEKTTFDGDNRLIIVNYGVVSLDAELDLYSAAKREWKDNATLNKLKLPFRTIAGDPLPGDKFYGAAFFLQNQDGWRLRPYEANHELIIIGNLYPEAEFLPMFVPTLGEYTVSISMERSSLTQETRPLAEWTKEEKDNIFSDVDEIKEWIMGKKQPLDGTV